MKKEARILILKACDKGFVAVVLRDIVYEEITFIDDVSALAEAIKSMKTFGELKYYIYISDRDRSLVESILASLGLTKHYRDHHIPKDLDVLCCIIKYLYKTIPHDQVYVCEAR